jgi:AcrR family transcriptional regulator
MPRNREFDTQKALEKAMQLFLEKGYAGTSMRDLVDYTGVAHAGLYQAFGSKQQLYESAVEHYRTRIINRFFKTMEEKDSGAESIRVFYGMLLSYIESGQFHHGCLMVNTMIEFGESAHPEFSFANSVAKHLASMKTAFGYALDNAVQWAELDENTDTDALSDYFVTVFNGIAVMARARVPMAQIRHTVQIALKELD